MVLKLGVQDEAGDVWQTDPGMNVLNFFPRVYVTVKRYLISNKIVLTNEPPEPDLT